MKHTTAVLHNFMPENFPETVAVIDKIIENLKNNNFIGGNLALIFFADYIEMYGINDFKTSVKAIVPITHFISFEFTIRSFILKYKEKMIDEIIKWSLHENHYVRRLASESSRSRLPWPMAIPALKSPNTYFTHFRKFKNRFIRICSS